MTRLRHCCVYLMILGLFAATVAEIPPVMSYQGKVTDAGGVPVPDGTYAMRFRVYDAEAGGTALWGSTTQSVEVVEGIFNVLLGEPPMPPFNLAFDEDLWLLVTFEGEDQLPRQRIGSVGYAFMASGLVPGTEISGSIGVGLGACLAAINSSTTSDASGLFAQASGSSGFTHGVYASNNSPNGDGVFARATASTGLTRGVYAQVFSDEGTAVLGQATSPTGTTVGIRGEVSSSDGNGVQGLALATTGYSVGVWGENASPDGDGVHGKSSASTGQAWGVWGESYSTQGRGVVGSVYATSGDTYGVSGESYSPTGRGVSGLASTTSGWNFGVYGETWSAIGDGVHGSATATDGSAYGGYFESTSSEGVGAYGQATASSGDTYGLYGKSSSSTGTGVYGLTTPTRNLSVGVSGETLSDHGIGVLGLASAEPGSTGCGVQGISYSWAGIGVLGYNANYAAGYGTGVYGWCASTGGKGVYGHSGASTGTAYGVYGTAGSPSGSSRVGVYYSGGLAGTGTKSCVVKTSKGPTMFYCQESPECWFEDFGDGYLAGGHAHIELDPVFLETVTITSDYPMRVFVELGGDCEGVYVERGLTGFDVIELRGGRSHVPFTYRVVAKRRDFETERLSVCEAARSDPYLYPALREKTERRFLHGIGQAEEYRRRTENGRASLKESALPEMSRIKDLRPPGAAR